MSTLKTPAVLLPQSSHPQLLWVASTPPSWAPLWLPPHLPITRLVASPAPPLRPSALQRVAVVTTARCGRAAPGAVMGSLRLVGAWALWLHHGFWWEEMWCFFGGPNITKSKCEKERDSKWSDVVTVKGMCCRFRVGMVLVKQSHKLVLPTMRYHTLTFILKLFRVIPWIIIYHLSYKNIQHYNKYSIVVKTAT